MADDKNTRAVAFVEQLTPVTFDDLVRMAGRVEFPVDLESHDSTTGADRG